MDLMQVSQRITGKWLRITTPNNSESNSRGSGDAVEEGLWRLLRGLPKRRGGRQLGAKPHESRRYSVDS